jgi:hypothetical protein
MSVNLNNLQYFTISDFSGGVNEFASTYKVADNEVVTAKNLSFKDSGGVKTRAGDKILDPLNTSSLTGKVESMYRYVKSDNTRKTVLYTTKGGIWIDNDDASFSKVPSSSTSTIISSDAKCRFAQYWDTMLFGTDRDGVYMYNPDVSTTSFTKMEIPSTWGGPFSTSFDSTGGHIDASVNDVYYYYRYTVDYQYGDFIAESNPMYLDQGAYLEYKYNYGTWSSGTTNSFALYKSYSGITFDTDVVARINIYRSNKYPAARSGTDLTEQKFEFFYIGSISASDYNDASPVTEVLFRDGGIAPGKRLEYNKMVVPPRARFIKMHKGRIWLANVQAALGTTEAWANYAYHGDWNTYPHRIYVSSQNNDGTYEPGVFYTDQFLDIAPFGTGITGIWSYRNEILVVFKPNSMWAISGDDPHPSTGNLSVRNISNSVGCIAPDSICEVEGRLCWLSNSGVYYWDGSSRPAMLKSDNIVDTIQSIDSASKSRVASVYDRKQRELLMSFPGPDTSGYNRNIAKFDLRTSAWSVDEYGLGMSAFTSIDQPNEDVKVYAGLNDITYNINTLFGGLAQLNYGTSTRYLYDDPSETWGGSDISFEIQTKFYDAGYQFADKKFKAILFEINSKEALTLNVVIDNRYDSRVSGYGFSIPVASQNALIWASTPAQSGNDIKWYQAGTYENKWAKEGLGSSLVYLDDRCWGKRISLVITGDVQTSVSIESITVFYELKETVRSTRS